MPKVFSDTQVNKDDIRVYGRKNNQRTWKFISNKYVRRNDNLSHYKVFITGANGSGKLGEQLSKPIVAKPNECHTQTFMSIGNFSTEIEAKNFEKYIYTKFLRFMLGTLKVTQNNPKDTWANIPLLDFSNNSEIQWHKPVSEIDKQLYSKYGLSDEEILFIEETSEDMVK